MKSIVISVPSYIETEIKEVASQLGVSAEALAAYFFANEVVHTRSAKKASSENVF